MTLRLLFLLACSHSTGFFHVNMIAAPLSSSPSPNTTSTAGSALPSGQSEHGVQQDRVNSLVSAGEQAETAGRNAEALADYQSALQIQTANAQLCLKIGLLDGKAGDFENARGAFQQAIQLQPNLAEAHYNLGLAIIGGAKQVPAWKDALREFEAAVALLPGYSDALNMSGVCLLETNDPENATRRFRAALQSKPDSAGIHFNLGRALQATGQSYEAFTEYTIAAAKHTTPYPDADIAIGKGLLERKDYPGAAEHLRHALAANPDIREAHYELAQALRHTGETREAQVELKHASALIQKQSDAVMSSHLSNESLDKAKAGRLSEAIQLAKKALWLDPENAIADYKENLFLADAGNLEAAILQLRKAISLAPLKSSFYVSLAKVEEKAGNPRAAREALDRAARLSPGHSDLAKRQQSLAASQALIAPADPVVGAPEKFPFGALADTADGHLAFATQLNKEGDILGSVGELLRATTLRPDRSDIRYNLAVARAQLGQSDQAELEFRKVLLQTPSDVDAHIALGSLLFSAKEFDDAASEFRRVLEIQPGNPEAARLLIKCPIAPHP